MSKRGRLILVLKYLFLSVVSLISVFPFYWMVVGATNLSVDITAGKMSFGTSLLRNVQELFASTNIAVGFVNSLIIATLTTLLSVFVCSLAGYGFEIFRSRGKDRFFSVLLLSMMMPIAAIMIPLYTLFVSLKMINTFGAVILPSVATAFLIFFFRQNTKTFSKEILEAARVDGLGELRIFLQIYFPTMRSTYAAAAIITFMNVWNSYLWPLVALQSPKKMTLPIIISALGSAYAPDFGIMMVSIVVATLPTAIIFFVMQKQFVAGMLGSVK